MIGKKGERMKTDRIVHPIPPLYNKNSIILILGSFPSVKSREAMFFYGHPQNRFWKVIAALLKEPVPQSVEEKRELLLNHRIAVWDVIQSCEIKGSSDSSIKNVVPNDFLPILKSSNIKTIYANGATAEKYYKKYSEKAIGRKCICLPSTSPANARFRLDDLIRAWQILLKDFD